MVKVFFYLMLALLSVLQLIIIIIIIITQVQQAENTQRFVQTEFPYVLHSVFPCPTALALFLR